MGTMYAVDGLRTPLVSAEIFAEVDFVQLIFIVEM